MKLINRLRSLTKRFAEDKEFDKYYIVGFLRGGGSFQSFKISQADYDSTKLDLTSELESNRSLEVEPKGKDIIKKLVIERFDFIEMDTVKFKKIEKSDENEVLKEFKDYLSEKYREKERSIRDKSRLNK